MSYERFIGSHESNEGWDLRDHISQWAQRHGFAQRHAELATWPAVPRHVYFLHLADNMLGGSGVLGFLEQALYPDIRGVHDALVAVGAPRLRHLFEVGLGATLGTNAEYNHYTRGPLKTDRRWLRAVAKPHPAAATIDSHEEGGTYWLVNHELSPAIRRYFAEQRGELVR